MTFREEMAQISSGLTLEMATELGATISLYRFAENDEEIENVPCLPSGLNQRQRVGGASIQDLQSSFVIPISSVWPLSNTPKIYDHIEYQGVTYFVRNANWDNLNSRWRIDVTRREDV